MTVRIIKYSCGCKERPNYIPDDRCCSPVKGAHGELIYNVGIKCRKCSPSYDHAAHILAMSSLMRPCMFEPEPAYRKLQRIMRTEGMMWKP